MIYREEWWAERIYFKDLDIDLQELENKCKELLKTDKGKTLSNIGGWHSNSITDSSHPVIKDLMARYREILDEISIDIALKEGLRLKHSNSWVNISQPKDYNIDHSHPNSLISSVFYVKSKDMESKIIFNMPEGHLKDCYFKDYIEKEDRYTSQVVSYAPQEGRAIFFPSYLMHRVLPSSEERISIASNFTVTNNL